MDYAGGRNNTKQLKEHHNKTHNAREGLNKGRGDTAWIHTNYYYIRSHIVHTRTHARGNADTHAWIEVKNPTRYETTTKL